MGPNEVVVPFPSDLFFVKKVLRYKIHFKNPRPPKSIGHTTGPRLGFFQNFLFVKNSNFEKTYTLSSALRSLRAARKYLQEVRGKPTFRQKRKVAKRKRKVPRAEKKWLSGILVARRTALLGFLILDLFVLRT